MTALGGSVNGSLALLTSAPTGIGTRQLERLQQSRAAAQPHHHARVAAAAARTANSNSNANATAPAPLGQSAATTANANANAVGNSLASLLTLNTSSQSSNDDPKPSQWSALDLGGMHMRNIATNLFKYSFLTQLYLNHNQLHFLPPEVAHLKSLALLDLSANKLQTVPPELGQLVSLKELLLFDNQLTYLPVELGNLFQLDLFGLEGNPLSEPYIGFLQKEGGALHIISYLRENIPAGAQPAEREWIVLEDDEK
ncbi:Glucose-repressible alcohol dehydrogenase transcriptional effector, partial [Rhizoclosmatium hyalinum]